MGIWVKYLDFPSVTLGASLYPPEHKSFLCKKRPGKASSERWKKLMEEEMREGEAALNKLLCLLTWEGSGEQAYFC